jgi:hypothetical protein
VFVSVELNEGSKFSVGHRNLEFHLNALSTHDGSGRAMFMDSSVCIVCANTFAFNVNQFAQKNKSIRFAIRHTKNSSLQLLSVAEGIENLISNRALFCASLDELGQHKVTEDQARFFSAGALAGAAADEKGISTRTLNATEELVALFRSGAGNRGENRLDLFSAFTDRYTHSHSGRGVQQQFVSSEFGSGQTMKDRVFHLLRSDDQFSKTVKRGEELILIS